METTNSKKYIASLIPDIKEAVKEGRKVKEEHLDLFCKDLKESLRSALEQGTSSESRSKSLRMSSIGTPNRKLWFALNSDHAEEGHEELDPISAINFLYGHIIEQFVLFLCRYAGHTVSEEQKEVELNGVKGHIDCKIDDILVDVKGMSSFGFNKFLSRSILKEDPYGYIYQISGYAEALGENKAGFLVFNKEKASFELVLLDDMNLLNASKRIDEIREVLKDKKNPPVKKCFDPVADGKSGNLILDKGCTFCQFKESCWKEANDGAGLRKFKYSNGTKYFVKIEKEPTVEEIFE